MTARFMLERAGWVVVAFGGIVFALAACTGTPNTPNGSVVGDPGTNTPQPPTHYVGAQVTVTIPTASATQRRHPAYLSPRTQSLAIGLASVDGTPVDGANTVTINTYRGASNCGVQNTGIVCGGTVAAVGGDDIFNVTAYAWPNATGPLLSVGTVSAKIGSNGGSVGISQPLSLALDGIIARITLGLSRASVDRGKPADVPLALQAFDGAGATIVGPSLYQSPIQLSIQGDQFDAFTLRSGNTHGGALSIVKPSGAIAVGYDGNMNASSITVQASVVGPNVVSAKAPLALSGTPPPPPGGELYVLNAGVTSASSPGGPGGSVAVYSTTANGNTAPTRTLQLDSSLYPRSIALDATGNLYVGYFDSSLGAQTSNGSPDHGNEIAVYAPGAKGNAQPTSILQADSSTQSALFPIAIAFDSAGDLVTYGATSVDANIGNAVLIYPPKSSGAVAPAHAWTFATPQLRYPGPNGLTLDASGNFYLSGTLSSALGQSYGVFVASASDRDNPAAPIARTIPSDTTTGMTLGQITNLALDKAGEIYVGTFSVTPQGNSDICQGLVNVFAAGASGGTTDVPPLRLLTLGGFATTVAKCNSVPFFPAIAVNNTSIFATNDLSSAVSVFATGAAGSVSPTQTISGAATGLRGPIAAVVVASAAPSELSTAPRRGRISAPSVAEHLGFPMH